MGRPRKHDKGLPAYVRIRHGSYQYRGRKLCRVEEGEAVMYTALAKLKAAPAVELVPAAVAKFKLEYLPRLAASTRKEHARLLDIFATDFSEFRVDQVDAPAIKRSIKNLYPDKLTAAKHYKARISTFFRWCIADEGLVKLNPCQEVWLDKPLAKKTPWTPQLFWAVRDRLEPMHQCYHDLSFLLYQRTTDVRQLRRSQVKDGVIHFAPSKTLRSSGKEVDIPITPAIQGVLERAAELSKAIAKDRGVICPFVIHTRQGASYTRSGIHSAYRRADEEIHGKATGLNPKALRPFAATMAKKMGYRLDQLQVGLAHTSQKTTEGYVQQHEVPVSEVALELPSRPQA
jgi:integrase